MNNHSQFFNFCSKKRLSSSKKSTLREKRDILRQKIRDYFSDTSKSIPKFKGQGSYAMGTTINPLDGEYDIDDGVYLTNIDKNKPLSEWEGCETVHSWVYGAVEKHTKEVKDKSRCVRVVYAGNFHVDFPIYVIKDDICYIAEKGEKQWHESDPKAAVDWFNDRENFEKQKLERLVIYLKVWKDYRKNKNKSVAIIDGFQFTVLAEKYFYTSDDDEEMFFKTVEKIYRNLNNHPPLHNPVDSSVDILEKYSDGFISDFKREFEDLYQKSKNAFEEKDALNSAELWQEVFGDEFDLPKSLVQSLTKNSLLVPHQEIPESKWTINQRYNVSLSGQFKKQGTNNGFKSFSCCDILPKHCDLKFYAKTDTPNSFDVHWQVVNTGKEAEKNDCLRGDIFPAKTAGAGGLNHNEMTLYQGTHWIECFIVKQGICVARSGKFLVKIGSY